MPALRPSSTSLLPGHCWGRDNPSLQHHDGSRSLRQELRDAPAPQRAPLPRERDKGGPSPAVSIPQQKPAQQMHSLASDFSFFRCSKPGTLPFPAEAASTAPRWFWTAPDTADRKQLVHAAGELSWLHQEPAVIRTASGPQTWGGAEMEVPAAQQEGGKGCLPQPAGSQDAGVDERRAPGSHSHLRSREIATMDKDL